MPVLGFQALHYSLSLPADYETKATYAVRLKVDGVAVEKHFTITVTDVNDAPVFEKGATTTVAHAENATAAVTTVVATDADVGQTVTFSLSGGVDAGLFTITPAGVLTFNTVPNFEMPTDMGIDNRYEVTITATDNGTPEMTTIQALSIIVTDVANEGGNPADPDHFVLKITTTYANQPFTFYSQDMDYMVDWGENNGFVPITTGNAPHTFASAGTHTIRFKNLNDIYINNRSDKYRYTSIEQWGTAVWNADMSNAFYGASNLTMNPTAGTPDMRAVTNMASMFKEAKSFNGDISGWNTAQVTDMSYMFAGRIRTYYSNLYTSFNQDIGGWNVASVEDMSGMFSGASSFKGISKN